MRFLLDTNIVSNLIGNPRGRIAERIKAAGEANVCTSIMVASEFRYGAARKASPRLTAQVDAVLRALATLPFEFAGDEAYGSIRTRLESAGTPIGGNDLLIAAQAVALDHVTVSGGRHLRSRLCAKLRGAARGFAGAAEGR